MTNLTPKEQAALNFLARNNGSGAKTKEALKDDNCSWFNITDLMTGLSLNRFEAAGIMSALSDKAMVQDHEAGSKIAYDRDTWYVTERGIDASDLGDVKKASAAEKAAAVRVAAKTFRDDLHTSPVEREVMRDLIALEDSSLAIMFDALQECFPKSAK